MIGLRGCGRQGQMSQWAKKSCGNLLRRRSFGRAQSKAESPENRKTPESRGLRISGEARQLVVDQFTGLTRIARTGRFGFNDWRWWAKGVIDAGRKAYFSRKRRARNGAPGISHVLASQVSRIRQDPSALLRAVLGHPCTISRAVQAGDGALVYSGGGRGRMVWRPLQTRWFSSC